MEELEPAISEVTRLLESLSKMQADLQVLKELKVRVAKTRAVLEGSSRAEEPAAPGNGRRAA
jgi:hypothetical protein